MMGYKRTDLSLPCRSKISRCDSTSQSSDITAKAAVVYILEMTVHWNQDPVIPMMLFEKNRGNIPIISQILCQELLKK
jgi:hypothetical protein